MSQYQTFVFKSYEFDLGSRTASFHYGYDDVLCFTETFSFDFDFVAYDEEAFDRALHSLFFVAGISYYKMYLAPEIKVLQGSIDSRLAKFLNNTYQRGLGEFYYVNQLPIPTKNIFEATVHEVPKVTNTNALGQLVGLGGGKDSLVSVEFLRQESSDLATWSVGHRPQLSLLVERIALPHYWVDRQWDRTMLDYNASGAYNGHVPISAILACVGVVAAILSGKQDVVVSNEHSANEPTLVYGNHTVNHQYSKSQQFEEEFQSLLQFYFGNSVRYYSLLRPFSEVKIAELFAPIFDKYHDVFSSCNRAFTHERTEMFWDGSCPKCAFVFLALTPFVDRVQLEALFGGKNLLQEPSLVATYNQLLGIAGDKPLECVGEIKESRAAMRLAQAIYPELSSYQFELPEDYDFRAWQSDSMPAEVLEKLRTSL
jgi:hypothetical protein